ncbi:uncharacterized membrane protein YgdD (TMEM256/DUF423 family) [Mucilaginibacter frigoritolerans]|jgi:uncharacterized membrane protein YgdD (TMEM256/DUF423 family)|uniref:Uncharacterized membrane protein YgdD (TMEM256/DUF423 family) n=1 Tax=Mucilaginibacter frigoritolerans TaxID=652788 RepID=A0A562TT77_9SPHI|nr:DUF423 domain-containing protein [Mucilaginibacter frigoritolerans]TWI96286.1 uncharacterized membrane protein YgdD (TMEM256/DUF423 family) [Mucilaginibacter frigoritolerans]
MKRKIIITAAIFGALAVIAGAFGAHGLQGLLTPKYLDVWHTAVQYQFYHVFALLFLAIIVKENNKAVNACYCLFTLGIIFFSGSLYLLSCIKLLGWDWLIFMGPITPIGGLLFIAGWIVLAITAFRNKIN